MGGVLFDLDRLERETDGFSAEFRRARPFPHVVLDDCLVLDASTVESFPDVDWPHWQRLGTYEPGKMTCQDRRVFPDPWGELVDELNAPRTLAFLEKVTGIKQLIPDPYLEGGGLHLSTAGGSLRMHTDFHIYTRLNLYRRINLILYLCPGWSAADGGELELKHARHDAREMVKPAWGRCVVFETNDVSVHGFTQPIASGKHRRSIAMYYYTANEAGVFSGDTTTHWREHGEHRGVQRVRYLAFRALMQTSRAFSVAAHFANPNQGLSWWRRLRAERGHRD
jgi:hypothetical protein